MLHTNSTGVISQGNIKERIDLLRKRLTRIVQSASFLVSLLIMAVLFLDYGFTLKAHEMLFVHHFYTGTWYFFLIILLLRVVLYRKQLRQKQLLMTLLIALLLYAPLLPVLFPLQPSDSLLSGMWALLTNKYYLASVLGLIAVGEISRGFIGIFNRRTNPALLMSAAFLVIIFIGTLLLLVPRSTLEHIHLSVIDALFVATSAVCVTGLSPVDVATTFTIEGQIVIALLIQVGGLGVMTITSFFALFFMGNGGLLNQFALRDMVSSDRLSSLVSTLLYILGFTFVIEALGMLLIWHEIHGTMQMGLHEELFFSLFHAISAFCNAGFSTLTGNLGNSAIMVGHSNFYLTISVLVILGGIGFPILVNFKEVIVYYIKIAWYRLIRSSVRPARYRHLTNINTKSVLYVTAILLICGTLTIALTEWNKAFASMAVGEKLVQAFFNAVAPRTAGFNSVDLTHFSTITLLGYLFLMWIGGASQSTAGGIKVNTFAVACANFLAVIRGRNRVVLLGRELPNTSLQRASAVVFGSIITILIGFIALVIAEPEIAPFHLLFETVSAFSTVGSSLNVTAQLGDVAKVIITLMMFIGRVGLITAGMSLLPHRDPPKFHYPKDFVIIN